jgi:hypothetical protein
MINAFAKERPRCDAFHRLDESGFCSWERAEFVVSSSICGHGVSSLQGSTQQTEIIRPATVPDTVRQCLSAVSVQVLEKMARPARLELATLCLEGRRSFQLSYGRILGNSIISHYLRCNRNL